MNTTSNNPIINVDFNNADEDHAIRLHLPVSSQSLKDQNLELTEGMTILMTDGEIQQLGIVTFREGIWVGTPIIK